MNETQTPLVSIVCLTYNQAPYVRDTLEGFLKQQTDYPYEIIIHDDASTDGTADIIREYAGRYPDLFRLVLQTENQYSKHHRFDLIIGSCIEMARGKYIAYCEGDDFWTDPGKLQMQTDYLEANPDCGLVYTDVSSLNVATGVLTEGRIASGKIKSSPLFAEHLVNAGFISPLTWVFRKFLMPVYDNPYPDFTYVMALDFQATSRVHFMPKVTATYRILPESASHSHDTSRIYVRAEGLLRARKDYIEKYPELMTPELKQRALTAGYRDVLVSSLLTRHYDTLREARRFLRHSKAGRLASEERLILLLGRAARPIITIGYKIKSRRHFKQSL